MALGARVSAIVRLIVREGMALAGAGLVLGLAVASFLSRLLTHLLFGIAPGDLLTYVTATALLGGVALAACSVPAWRATRIQPTIALRNE